LLFDADDVGGALVAREQVLAVLGVEKCRQRLDAAHDEDEVVLAFERKHGVDEIVPRALLAELDLEAVGEEGEERDGNLPFVLLNPRSQSQSRTNFLGRRGKQSKLCRGLWIFACR